VTTPSSPAGVVRCSMLLDENVAIDPGVSAWTLDTEDSAIISH
jgi:hypothetical protein